MVRSLEHSLARLMEMQTVQLMARRLAHLLDEMMASQKELELDVAMADLLARGSEAL